MKITRALSLLVLLAGLGPALQACALIASPLATTAIGGAQLAIKGVELQSELGKADAQEAIDTPFHETWGIISVALANLDIEISRIEKNEEGDGGLIEGKAGKTKVKVVVVRLTEKITEIGIWTNHDHALARLIVERIKKEAASMHPEDMAESGKGGVHRR